MKITNCIVTKKSSKFELLSFIGLLLYQGNYKIELEHIIKFTFKIFFTGVSVNHITILLNNNHSANFEFDFSIALMLNKSYNVVTYTSQVVDIYLK